MPGEVAVGSWWRATRYEVRGRYTGRAGYGDYLQVIRPARKAKIEEFDPWEVYWEGRSKRTTEPPHAQLANMIRGLRLRIQGSGSGELATPPMALDLEGEKELCAWCCRYGLLGLFAHRVQRVAFAREWQPGEEHTSTTYLQAGGKWNSLVDTRPVDPSAEEKERPPYWPHTSVIAQYPDPHGYRLKPEPNADEWARFFPNAKPIKESLSAEDFDEAGFPRDFPPPNTQRFWKQYSEPVLGFLSAAWELTNALDQLASGKGSNPGPEQTLGILASGIAPKLVKDDAGNHQREWMSPSLLGTLAFMAQEDLLGTKRLVRCKACGRIVTSSDSRTEFCDPRCRQKLQKRRQRAKSK